MAGLRRMRLLDWLAAASAVVVATIHGGAKIGSTNGPERVAAALRPGADGCTGSHSPASEPLRIVEFAPGTDVVSMAFCWATNFSPDMAWLEVYGKAHALTNSWQPLVSEAVAPGATSLTVSVAATNAAAAFYTGRIDTLGIDVPGCLSCERPDGSRLFVSTGPLTVPVSVRRPDRDPAFPPQDAAFAADPFAHADGLSYDPDSSSVTADGYGSYDLPDGGTLLVLKNPKVTFGVPHSFPGRTAVYDAASGGYRAKTPYPLDTPSLWRSFRRGTTPTTGCSCVPAVDYGGGLTASADTPQGLRSGSGARGGFPQGVNTRFDYADGGVWAELVYGTNVLWRGWCAHDQTPDDDGDQPDEDDEQCCDCGDMDSLEGPAMGSIRFRIPLGSPKAGEVSGFLYLDRDEVFSPEPSSFSVMARGDAHVTDTTSGDVRTVACGDTGGRTLVLSPTGRDEEVEIQVRDTASGGLLHTWHVYADDTAPSVRFSKTSVLGSVMQDKSYSLSSGVWRETDELSGREDRRETHTVGAAGERTRDERKVLLGGVVARHTSDAYDFVGSGANAVMRRTMHRELGADGAWTTNTYSYWSDAARTNRHGKVRMASGDGIAWSWRAYDGGGREVFRLDQRDGSPAPLDRTDYAVGNLPGVSCAFATELCYEPLPGDSARSNDWDRVRTETRYAVDGGAARVIARTWTRHEHGITNVWPVVRTTRIRACRADATMSDPGNEVTVEERYDDRSGEVPYTLRGELVSSVDADGVQTVCERTLSDGVVRTVVRRVAGAAEAPVRRVELRDLAYGNLLYEAESPTADPSVEFGWRRHSYDEKNRLRLTEHDDGTFETNAYSCCRLLWSQDRSGARRVRHAQTGTDHLYHAWVDTAVSDLPKDPQFKYGPWRWPHFKNYVPVVERRFDGLGRETNTVVCTGRLNDEGFHASANLSFRASTTFPQGVSDVSETVGFRGLVTRRKTVSSQGAERTDEEEYEPGESSPSAATTAFDVRGGGTETWRLRGGGWSARRTASLYGADGCRVDYDVTESSDGGVVVGSATDLDFLGRVTRRTTPVSDVFFFYEGASPRVASTFDAVSGVAAANVYDETGGQVGEESCGVSRESRTSYEADASNDWWRVETSTVSADGATNSCVQTRTRLTGLSDARRSEVAELRDGAEVSRAVRSYDAASGTERETVSNAVGGVSWTVSRLGHPVETGSPGCVVSNFYAPTGKVYIRQRSVGGGGPVRFEAVMTDALGDEVGRTVCDRYWLDEAPSSHVSHDCRGNRSHAVDALGNETFAAFDPDGNVEHEGGATYPALHAYDTAGRRTAVATTRDGASGDVTQWGYDAATGACTNKTYADGSQTLYTHTPDGLPLRTTYASGRWRENAYDARRQIVAVEHSDGESVSFAYDAFSNEVMASNDVSVVLSSRRDNGDCTNETTVVGNEGKTIERDFDALGRLTEKDGTRYAYNSDGLLASASNEVAVVEYAYTPDRLDAGYALTLSNGVVFSRNVARDGYRRSLATVITSSMNGNAVENLAYTYDALGRPTARNADAFGYNERGEVVSAQIGANSFAHAYDYIGNQTNFAANAATNVFTHNAINQIETITVSQFSILNSSFSISHDLDGNMLSDGVLAFTYDAANRLKTVSSNGVLLVTNFYDAKSRRVKKTTPEATTTFFYDDWNLVEERVAYTNGTTSTIRYYWGKDLSGTLQGAGGVGGLLYLAIDDVPYIPCLDNNGNVTRYLDANGNTVAQYTYDAFGKTISQSGQLAHIFRHRFSTKYHDAETGLYYYGYRFYSPPLMRWLNRDPIEEEGGLNLYGFCGNNAISFYDALGLYRLIYHKFGAPPPDGWKKHIDASFKATFRQPNVFRCLHTSGKMSGKVSYRVEFTPKESLFEIFLRKSFTFAAIRDELDHVNCALIYERAFDAFKTDVEKILDTPLEARRKYDAAAKRLQEAEQKCKKCNDALDAPGGPHGH